MLPVLFISHGSPALPLETDAPAHTFLRGLLDGLQPRAILVLSAHWEQEQPTLTAAPQHSAIHDFYGFPQALYELVYNPPGAPDAARRAATLLDKAGMAAALDVQRGLDHGAWSPLLLAVPKADIPVVQISLLAGLDASIHLALGRTLAPLREEGVLILGSGGAVHNLRALDWGNFASVQTAPWAAEFQSWLDSTMAMTGEIRSARLASWLEAPGARQAHPRAEHLLPLHVAVGAAEGERALKIHDTWQMANMSMAAWRLG